MLYVFVNFVGGQWSPPLHPQTLKLEWKENTSQADQTGTFQCFVYGLVLSVLVFVRGHQGHTASKQSIDSSPFHLQPPSSHSYRRWQECSMKTMGAFPSIRLFLPSVICSLWGEQEAAPATNPNLWMYFHLHHCTLIWHHCQSTVASVHLNRDTRQVTSSIKLCWSTLYLQSSKRHAMLCLDWAHVSEQEEWFRWSNIHAETKLSP